MKIINGEEFKIILSEYQDREDRAIKQYTVENGLFKSTNIKSKRFDTCVFSKCRFNHCNFGESEFTACIFSDCVFDNCYSQSSVFYKCTFLFTSFFMCLMEKSEYNQSHFTNCEIKACRMVNAKFSRCHFISYFMFINANLTNVIFTACTRFNNDDKTGEMFGLNVNFKNMQIRNCNFNLYVEIDPRVIEIIKRLKGGNNAT